jgi:RNA polymerase sigma-70 factor (ECF subfamily)
MLARFFQKAEPARERTAVQAPASREVPEAPIERDRPAVTSRDVRELFDAHGAYVCRTLRCLGVGERELGDVCQEVFLVVHRRLPEFEGRASIRTWLYAICLRRALAHRRKAARLREEAVPEPPDRISDEPAPDDEMARAQKLALALEVLARIDEERRAVFVLYEVEQLPMSEVAEIVGCPMQTAYSRLYAARKEIASLLRRSSLKVKR